jgi:DNA mismatch repair protein MutS
MLSAEFVPNDIELGTQSGDVMIITGPNMSGKSTYIRQTALLILMAQAGSFIPAKEATIGLVDRIFTRVGASDELVRGQSTFMVEMTETANIINNATSKSLVILDEVGRGTSTYDGLSLAWAITEHIANKIKCRTLFATHYHELTELAELFANIKNCNVAVREWMDEVVFLHKILTGGTDKSYGIHVAKLAGIPRPILERSKEILTELETAFQKEAAGSHLAKHKTKVPDADLLFVQKHKPVLDKLASVDVNNLTPIEAINLLNQIKSEIEGVAGEDSRDIIEDKRKNNWTMENE